MRSRWSIYHSTIRAHYPKKTFGSLNTIAYLENFCEPSSPPLFGSRYFLYIEYGYPRPAWLRILGFITKSGKLRKLCYNKVKELGSILLFWPLKVFTVYKSGPFNHWLAFKKHLKVFHWALKVIGRRDSKTRPPPRFKHKWHDILYMYIGQPILFFPTRKPKSFICNIFTHRKKKLITKIKHWLKLQS